ncbi:WYL domain-containing protein [Moorena sp. SIO3H5]|uniref:WYL domain-containing protein n=1 Tax=Moorena sp. SIO3H5 TaxID=2607834 RepID=UPI0013B9C04A|nr:WYL domain-containing protein [Moorena sp. SIO3H5]NEO73848.1 WYL domain-containing protein [Moorena sp. SIO3H5]
MSKNPIKNTHTALICHFLIGPPGSGKSTLAKEIANLGNYRIISTDHIRKVLYGHESIQGNWSEIEAEVLSQISQGIASNQPIIYDATNAKRPWRMALLNQLTIELNSQPLLWMAWHLCTPLKTCREWNRKRSRQVPEYVIESMFKSLQNFPPLTAEGFAAVNQVKGTVDGFDISKIQKKIKGLPRTLTNRTNRTHHSQITLHPYSSLLDFDRLLHLIALIIRYPNIGTLHSTDPTEIERVLGTVPEFATPLEEVCALMAKLNGEIYADRNAIATDLQWLQDNGLINSNDHNRLLAEVGNREQGIGNSGQELREKLSEKYFCKRSNGELQIPIVKNPHLLTHAYSDLEPFQRLIKTIRFILHHPFLPKSENSSLKTLTNALQEDGVIIGNGIDTLRKDIEKILKPYKLLRNFPLKQGYFAGTGIFSTQELGKVFAVLQSQAKSLDDPMALSTYEMFQQRMTQSKLDHPSTYPVRAIRNRCIVDTDSLQASALLNHLDKLENAIAQGELLELNRIKGGGRFAGDHDRFFQAWPLQIVFYNHAWYLAFQHHGGNQDKLFRFERLDRLFLGRALGQTRDMKQQWQSLQKLQKLHQASAGLFLGNSAREQQQLLSSNKSERSAVQVTFELWFNDDMFRFVSEGTKRFQHIKMSPPLTANTSFSKSLFSLPQTKDPNFPNRFQAILPKWALDDIDFLRWIIGFGGQVKVVQPQELVDKIHKIGADICRVYQE